LIRLLGLPLLRLAKSELTKALPVYGTYPRNETLDPDWLRVDTDIVGGSPAPTFNAAFTLRGEAVPEPTTIAGATLAGAAILKLRRRQKQ
jgi:hypothetical protein